MATCLLMCALHVFATEPGEKNVSIREKTERYEFTFNRNNEVNVLQTDVTQYLCTQFRTTIGYADFYNEKSTINDVRVRLDGKKFNVKPIHKYYAVDEYFYSDQKICYFELPLEKKGAEASVELEKTILDPRYLTAIYFDEPYFTMRKEITFVIPDWMHVDIKEMNFDKSPLKILKTTSRDERSKTRTITYTVRNWEARDAENAAPGPSYILPHLLVMSHYADAKNGKTTFFQTTADLYSWYRSLVQTIGNDPTSIAATAKSITKNATTDVDKVKAVFNYVQDNIRYIAFEDGIAGFRPAKAQDVLSKKYGDCKGMANLTKELLVSLGIDARLCWIGTNHIAYDYSLPSLSVDNHMICAVQLNKKRYFLDATESYIGFDQYAERIQGRQVMIEDGDKYILEKVPLRDYKQNVTSEKRVLKIEGTDLVGSNEILYTGESMEFLLTAVHNIKKNKLDEAILTYLKEDDKRCDIQNLVTSDLSNWNTDLSFKYNVRHKEAITAFDKDMYLEIDFRKEYEGLEIDTTKRKSDYLFPYKSHTLHETVLILPKGYKATDLPKDVMIDRPTYAIKVGYKRQNDQVIYQKEIILKNTRLPKSEMSQWNKDVKALTELYRNQITLSKS
ncbi:transglutaminase superfamily protein [Chitinophaga skermanii]|uniref:Transglutaminase superfamily protein n=1 Tax=Chitinophaga skermanii TaxID=331697 RepID=A0A327R9E3_9BACT|nr:transglutaminase domain-containing protein [Chitinophaga skermanii]RAJ10537.1 transglutaminase superfamily protein [Chitinophaga skermanii]